MNITTRGLLCPMLSLIALFAGANMEALAVLPVIGFTSSNYVVIEADGTAIVSVSRSGDTTTEVSVHFGTTNGTALANQDYLPGSGTLLFHAGETNKVITIAIVDDCMPEPNETIVILLTNPQDAVLGPTASAVLQIEDDDRAGNRVLGFHLAPELGGPMVVLPDGRLLLTYGDGSYERGYVI